MTNKKPQTTKAPAPREITQFSVTEYLTKSISDMNGEGPRAVAMRLFRHMHPFDLEAQGGIENIRTVRLMSDDSLVFVHKEDPSLVRQRRAAMAERAKRETEKQAAAEALLRRARDLGVHRPNDPLGKVREAAAMMLSRSNGEPTDAQIRTYFRRLMGENEPRVTKGGKNRKAA